MQWVVLNEENYTVSFTRPGVMIDLGAIGKGYAIEKSVEILRDVGVESALIHGGTSTVHALGSPPDAPSWKVAVAGSREEAEGGEAYAELSLPVVELKDEAMSVSAVWGKFFKQAGKTLGHVIDPRTGEPVSSAMMSVVVLPSATDTDALSTGLLVMGSAGLAVLARLRPDARALVVTESESGPVLRGNLTGT